MSSMQLPLLLHYKLLEVLNLSEKSLRAQEYVMAILAHDNIFFFIVNVVACRMPALVTFFFNSFFCFLFDGTAAAVVVIY